MNNLPLTLNIYIAKVFLKKLFYVLISISLLIFMVNIFETFNDVKNVEHIAVGRVLTMASLLVPDFLSNIAVFIIMLATMLTLFGLSSKSEITVMRSVGMSLWRILLPIMLTSFVMGLVFIFAFLPLAITATKKYVRMEQEIIKNEKLDNFAPKNGVWLKQDNIDNKGEEIKIRAGKIYRNDLLLEDVTVWFTDKDNKFYRKIDAKNMALDGRKWKIKSGIVNDKNNLNKVTQNIEIPTNLEPQFIIQKVINNFENVKLFSVTALPKLIKNLEDSGFSSRKFKVYFHYLLSQPLLFVGMSLFSSYFSINNVRNKNNALYVVFGVIFGLIIYVVINIINALGVSGMLPIFVATWLFALLFLALAILLLFKKENS